MSLPFEKDGHTDYFSQLKEIYFKKSRKYLHKQPSWTLGGVKVSR